MNSFKVLSDYRLILNDSNDGALRLIFFSGLDPSLNIPKLIHYVSRAGSFLLFR
jgi:hypothetical protein